ncbi:hypothetical protein Bbelb_013430 [Branchiostoma belcheri]|nr:hypothetical protein Bbelb_013430 [Branchiostoma belcheri]
MGDTTLTIKWYIITQDQTWPTPWDNVTDPWEQTWPTPWDNVTDPWVNLTHGLTTRPTRGIIGPTQLMVIDVGDATHTRKWFVVTQDQILPTPWDNLTDPWGVGLRQKTQKSRHEPQRHIKMLRAVFRIRVKTRSRGSSSYGRSNSN